MKREKLIVYITMAGFDDSFAVLAESRENGFIAVEGNQLLLASTDHALHKQQVNKAALYHLYRGDYKRKCYDCFTFKQRAQQCEPSINPRYVLRCQGYHPRTGSPGFSVDECVKAGVPAHIAKLYVSSETGLLHIKPMMLRAC